MDIIYSKEFEEDVKKLKDKETIVRILKQIKKLELIPESGKPLRYDLRNHRCLRVHPFRIIYRIENNSIIVCCFDHRKDVYE